MNTKKVVKVNFGCGIHVVHGDGWVNCDNSLLAKLRRTPFWFVARNFFPEIYRDYPKVRIVDIRRPLPFRDSTVDYIYCSQVVEHLYFWDLLRFLRESSRILKPGGVMRILTPDLRKLIKLYSSANLDELEGNDGLRTRFASDHFNLMFYPRSWISREQRSLAVKFAETLSEQHKYIFDSESLGDLLSKAGFMSVLEVGTERSLFPNVKDLDRYQAVSLEIEAIK